MGLDQYARHCPAELLGDKQIGFDDLVRGNCKEFAYWRKHPGLQGWMERLYVSKGGQEEFNCAAVRLTEEDLAGLEDAILRSCLPSTDGFFFGSMRDTSDQNEEDLHFIATARLLLSEGRAVFYTSWW